MSYNCEILADSKNEFGDRLTTMKITFPRFILAEMNTHRMFSRNSASSRAIPFKKMVKMVEENPFIPIAWQKDHKGMQGTEYITDEIDISNCKSEWLSAKQRAINSARDLSLEKVTKQLCNRLLEPFMWHTVIVTATEWKNFFKLRCPQYKYHGAESSQPRYYKSKKDWLKDWSWNFMDDPNITGKPENAIEWLEINESQADIHIQAIAELMWDAYNESKPKQLKAGEWHIPFGDNLEWDVDKSDFQKFYYNQKDEIDEELLKVKIAIARCARISYQTLGDNPKIDYEADLRLYDILSKSGHWSPFEHVARCMSEKEYYNYVNGVIKEINPQEDYTCDALDWSESSGWCRNFRGFIQQRSLID